MDRGVWIAASAALLAMTGGWDCSHKTYNLPGKFLSYMQSGLPVLASINPGNDLAVLMQKEGVGRVCTDHSVDTLQRLAVELADEISSGKSVSARCRAL